jgi:hypothetical protein
MLANQQRPSARAKVEHAVDGHAVEDHAVDGHAIVHSNLFPLFCKVVYRVIALQQQTSNLLLVGLACLLV